MSDKRKTLNNIALDIIKQRVENINRNASFNRSMHDLHDDAGHDDINRITPIQLDKVMTTTTTTKTPRPITIATSTPPTAIIPLKPLKRKLFAPPSLFPEHSPIRMITPQKTDTKKTVANQKRKKNDLCAVKSVISTTASSKSDEKKKPTEKPRNNRKTLAASRRSTMLFETPPTAVQKAKSTESNALSPLSTAAAAASNSTAIAGTRKCGTISTPSLVFTSMHQPQIDFITEVRQG